MLRSPPPGTTPQMGFMYSSTFASTPTNLLPLVFMYRSSLSGKNFKDSNQLRIRHYLYAQQLDAASLQKLNDHIQTLRLLPC